nr:benzyl alcohol O-benzoyltransferase-like [Tanacetum cinerariifolium]
LCLSCGSYYSGCDYLWVGLTRFDPILQPDPEDEMRIMCLVNACKKFNPSIPVGYYGNAFCCPATISTARDLVNKPLGYALELVIKVKSYVTEEYMRSVADLMVTKGRPFFTIVQSYIVSDVTHAGIDNVDFGWGKATFAGPSRAGVGAFPTVHGWLDRRHLNHLQRWTKPLLVVLEAGRNNMLCDVTPKSIEFLKLARLSGRLEASN